METIVKERFKITPAVYLIVVKDDKILLLRRKNTGFEDGNYSLVAGHPDGNETFTQAMIREAKEEADIGIKPEDLKFVHVMHRKEPNQERIDFFLMAKNWEGEPKNMEPNRCDDLGWFELGSLPDNTIPYIRHAVDSIKNEQFYSEYGW